MPFVSSANLEYQVLEQRAPSVATPAARRAVAALAARVLGAPVGFVSLGDVVDFRGQLVAGWGPGRPDQVARTVSTLLSGTSTTTHHEDLTLVADLEGSEDVRAVAAAPLRAPTGAVVGHVGALDAQAHAWSSADLEALEDFAAMVGATPDLQSSADSVDLRHQVRSLVQEVRALDEALVPLIQRSEERGDAALVGHAATVRARLGALRGKQDRLRARAGIVGPVAGTVDLARLVADVVADVEKRTDGGPVRFTTDGGEFPVLTGEVATRTVLGQFLDHTSRQFGAEAVRVHLHRREGTETAGPEVELEVTVSGLVRAGDLARAGAGFGRSRGVPVAGTHIDIQGEQVRLLGADYEAEARDGQTIVRTRWPLEDDR